MTFTIIEHYNNGDLPLVSGAVTEADTKTRVEALVNYITGSSPIIAFEVIRES